MISDFRREVDGNCALLGHYATSSGDFFPASQDHLSIPSSGAKNPKENRVGFRNGMKAP